MSDERVNNNAKATLPEGADATASIVEEELEAKPTPTAFEQFLERFRRPAGPARATQTKDRMRGALVLAATTIGVIFLFLTMFTSPLDDSRKDKRRQPTLGRPEAANDAQQSPAKSIVPQLNATPPGSDVDGELTEKDLLGTMRNRPAPQPAESPKHAPQREPLRSIDFGDPDLDRAYQSRRVSTPAPGVEPEVQAEPRRAAETRRANTAATDDPLRKPSLVYVRSRALGSDHRARSLSTYAAGNALNLPAGTKFIARFEQVVSSATKIPVSAVIEYNYERNGELIVPAGSRAHGKLTQATPQGWVHVEFDSLELPDRERFPIAASALSMDHGALKGQVNGKNTGKKFLVRAMTGLGTIASFAVGGRGLSGQIDNSVLLRERLSSNIAVAGEQQLSALAYQQNIVVTIPANTRFYLVIAESKNTTATGPRPLAESSFITQELQELLKIRNEMRQMNQLLRTSQAGATPEPDTREP